MMDEKKKKKLIIIISSAVAAIILIILLCVSGCVNKKNSGAKAKANVCTLAKTYAERGEYDRALNKLDDYLEKHGDDQEIWDLWNSILDMKKEAGGNGAGGNFAGGNTYNYNSGDTNNQNGGYPDSLKIDVDTSGISSAMQDSLSSMKSALEESSKQAEENLKFERDKLGMSDEDEPLESDEAEG